MASCTGSGGVEKLLLTAAAGTWTPWARRTSATYRWSRPAMTGTSSSSPGSKPSVTPHPLPLAGGRRGGEDVDDLDR